MTFPASALCGTWGRPGTGVDEGLGFVPEAGAGPCDPVEDGLDQPGPVNVAG